MEVKLIKLCQIPRCQAQWASELQTAGGWEGIWEKHHSILALFLSSSKTSTAEDETGQYGPLWPHKPLVWSSTAALVIVSAICNCCQAAEQQDSHCLHQAKRQKEQGEEAEGTIPTFTWYLKCQGVIQPCSHGGGIFRGNTSSNSSPPSLNDFYTYCDITKQPCASTEPFEAQTKWGFTADLPGDVSGLQLKRKVKWQLAAVSAARECQRSDWECKEREVNPACKKTVYSSRAKVFTYPLQLRVNPPHPQSLITGPRNQLVVFRT